MDIQVRQVDAIGAGDAEGVGIRGKGRVDPRKVGGVVDAGNVDADVIARGELNGIARVGSR